MNSSSRGSSPSADEDEERRDFRSIIAADRRFRRSSSSSSSSNDDEEGPRESALITLIYHGDDDDEILVLNRRRIAFKGCLQRQDHFRFKIRRDEQLDLKFYVNDRFRSRWNVCCEFRFLDEQTRRNEIFQLENIFGSKPCRRCEKSPVTPPAKRDIQTNSSSRKEKTKKIGPKEKKPKEERKVVEPTKPPRREKRPSEGFPAELSEAQPLNFEPVPPTPSEENAPDATKKRVYGPPQLSMMLSINESADPSCLRATNEVDEEKRASPFLQRTDSIRIDENKQETHRESDENEESPPNDSSRFLRSMSSHMSASNDETPRQMFHRTTQLDAPMSGHDATQTILSRLGITRHEQTERNESSSNHGPREKGNVEHFVLLYLHESPLEPSSLPQLRSVVNFVKTFDDLEECFASINSFSNEKLLIVASAAFAEQILPRVEDLHQLFYVYVLAETNEEPFFSPSRRVRGVFSTIAAICREAAEDIQTVLRDLVSYIQFPPDESNAAAVTFVYSSLINELLLDNDECASAMKELVHFSRDEYQGNAHELAIIDEFQTDYQSNRAIWWFTRPCFVSKMLNRAFQTPDFDILYRFRLFIQHLRAQIEHESVVEADEQLQFVYLGHTIGQNDLDEVHRSRTSSTFLFFNQFLSGTSSLAKAIEVTEQLPRPSDDFVPLIIRIDLSPQLKFANRSSLRYLDDDRNDVLLNIGLIARIVQVEKNAFDDETQKTFASIHLQLVPLEREAQLRSLLQSKRDEVLTPSPLISLVKLMLLTNQNLRAGHFIESVHNDPTIADDPNIQGSVAASCHLIGAAAHQQGDFHQAVHLFQLSLKTFLRFVEEDSVQLSPTYNNIGSMFFRQEMYEQSLVFHIKALDVQLSASNPSLSSIASYSNNIGVVYLKQGNFAEALKAFHRALKVLKQLNKENDGDLASTHDNLGDAYLLSENYEQALSHYRQALQLQQQVEPKNAQALASFSNSLGNVYNKLQRYSDALTHFQAAVKYQKEYLPDTHPTFASLYNNIGSMFYRQELFEEALPFYLKSLEIELMVLPANHPTIAVTHFNIATTYTGLGKFDEAIRSTERSVEQLLKTLPESHPEVAENRAYIDVIRKKQMLKGLFQQNGTDA